MTCKHLFKVAAVIGLLLGAYVPAGVATTETVRISFGGHPLDAYAVGLLELAFSEIDMPMELKITERSATQGRLKLEVMKGKYDIMWAASTAVDEADMLPIRIPMLKGLLGYRVLIIHAGDQQRFNDVATLDDLKAFSMGQALDWADTGVLKANGFEVVTSSNYPSLFNMLVARRFDAFPRGIMEPWGELAARDLPSLKVEDSLVLVYPMPFYFFVKKDNLVLAKLVELGLEKSLASGSFDRYFTHHLNAEFKLDPTILEGRKHIYLTNPTLTPQTPLARKELWFATDTLLKGE